MIKVVFDNPNVFNGRDHLIGEEEQVAMDTIAKAIVSKRSQVASLIKKHGIALSASPTNEELLSGLFVGFKSHPGFTEEFAALSLDKKRMSNVESNSGLNAAQAGASSGAGWGSAISGIVGGIGGILSIFGHQDSAAMASQTNAQILYLIAEKEKARRRNNTIAIVSVIVISILATVGLVYYAKTQKKANV